jgi:hypothetical protein
MRSRLALSLSAAALLSCGDGPALHAFTSDGCTFWPDGKLGDRRLWCDCCFAHDMAYWRGGTEAERKQVDEALRACVVEKTGDTRMATVMHDGVRVTGSPVFPAWYRWGYGWPYGRGYQPLNHQERAQTREKLRAYFGANRGGYCARK